MTGVAELILNFNFDLTEIFKQYSSTQLRISITTESYANILLLTYLPTYSLRVSKLDLERSESITWKRLLLTRTATLPCLLYLAVAIAIAAAA